MIAKILLFIGLFICIIGVIGSVWIVIGVSLLTFELAKILQGLLGFVFWLGILLLLLHLNKKHKLVRFR